MMSAERWALQPVALLPVVVVPRRARNVGSALLRHTQLPARFTPNGQHNSEFTLHPTTYSGHFRQKFGENGWGKLHGREKV